MSDGSHAFSNSDGTSGNGEILGRSRGSKAARQIGRDGGEVFQEARQALDHLSQNPRHNSLASHEIDDLTRKHGFKIFQSHLENHTPAAGRLFWAYGPDQGDITVLAIEPHPEDQKRGAYARIKLSALPRSSTRGKN